MPRKRTDEQLLGLMEEYRSGVTQTSIALREKISTTRIGQLIRQAERIERRGSGTNMKLTTDQREMLLRLLNNRAPTFGLSASAGGGVKSTLLALERRGLVTKRAGQWCLTNKGHVEATASRAD